MGGNHQRFIPPPCPMCGKEEGAFMGNTTWGHDAHCCSDACGHAYRDSEQRRALEYERALFGLEIAKRRVADWAPRATQAPGVDQETK